MKRLKNRARAIVDQLQDPPLCYKAYYEDSIYDITCAELLCPVAPYHFDHTNMVLRMLPDPLRPLAMKIAPWLHSDRPHQASDRAPPVELAEFVASMGEIVEAIPQEIRELSDDQIYTINRHFHYALHRFSATD